MYHIGNFFLRFFGISRYIGNVDEIQAVSWDLLSNAQSNIKIVAGELTNAFYTSPETLEILEKAQQRGVSVELVHGPNRDEESAALLRQRGVKLYRLDKRPRTHFAVVDGRDAKVEEYHLPGEKKRVYYVKYKTSYLAGSLEEKFDDLKAQAQEES